MTKQDAANPWPAPERAEDLYIDLLKRSLINWIYPEGEVFGINPLDREQLSPLKRVKVGFQDLVQKAGYRRLPRRPPFEADKRLQGKDWPQFAHSMLGSLRLQNIQSCVEKALADGIPGDLIEAGVWRGGGAILMRGLLKAHGVADRTVWVADSFEGLPPPDAEKYPADAGDRHFTWDDLAVSLEKVQSNFARYGLLDDQVRFLKGWFKDTLGGCEAEQFAVIRVDGDMYESTMDGLKALYPKVAVGGFVIIDDFQNLDGCQKAVHDYRAEQGIEDPIEIVDWSGAYWRRSK